MGEFRGTLGGGRGDCGRAGKLLEKGAETDEGAAHFREQGRERVVPGEREFRGAWTLRSEEKGGFGEGGAVEVTGEKARGGSCLKEETNLLSDPRWIVLRPSEVNLESPCLWLNPSYSFFFFTHQTFIKHLLCARLYASYPLEVPG